MNISEFLNDPILRFPIPASTYFPEHLSKTFTHYLELLNSIDDENKEFVLKQVNEITKSCDQIQSITNNYFEGKLIKSYEQFSNLVSHFEQYLVQKNKNAVRLDLDTHLFRVRNKLEKDYSVKDMFHVPFENRYTIKTKRFSLSGLPCLYLSNSIYTCWEELERPLFSQMAVSRFETHRKNFKYLDLTVDLWYLHASFREDIHHRIKSDKDHESLQQFTTIALEKFLQLYPFYVACYTKVFNKNADFKPEYIFPQMLMEWIVNSDWLDGIVYESTKTARLKISGGIPNLKDSLNFAIPVRSNSENGFCKLIANNLKLTKPTSWEMVNILKPDVATKDIDLRNDILGKIPSPPIIWFNLQNDENLSYHKTAFGRFEYYLFNQPVFGISEP